MGRALLAVPVLACVAVLGSGLGVRAAELTLNARALAQAVDIGQSRLDAVRDGFHRPYRVAIARAPVDYVEVVTPFRRVVLAAETRARQGDRGFGQRQALAVVNDAPGRIDLIVEMTFHPQNTFVGVPAYEVRLVSADAPAAAVFSTGAVTRVPRFGPRMAGTPLSYPFLLTLPVAPGSLPLSGGALIVSVDGVGIDAAGAYDLQVMDADTMLATARVDLAALR